MVGLVFMICIFAILTLVGILFAWMVRLASISDPLSQKNSNLAVSIDDDAQKDPNPTHPAH